MKKAIVLLLALMLVGAIFAEDSKVTYSVSGDGWVKWGYNLETNNHGFNNGYDLEADISLGTIAASKAGAEGETVYGKVSLSALDINLSVDAQDTAPAFDTPDTTISASIVAGPLTVGVYTAASLTQNNASHFAPYQDDDGDWDGASDMGVYPTAYRKGSLKATYSLGTMGSVYGTIASLGDWAAGGLVNDNYAVAAGASLTPVSMLTVALGGFYDLEWSDMGFTTKVTVKPVDGVSAFVALDGFMPDGGDLAMDAAVNVAATFGKTTIGADVWYADGTANSTHAASPSSRVWTYDGRLDAKVSIADTGTVENLAASVALYAIDVMADPAHDPMLIGVADSISYKIALSDTTYVTPYQKAVYDLGVADDNLYLSVGANAMLFANTLFTVDYTMNKKNNLSFPGAWAGYADPVFSIKAKVSF